MASDEIDSGSYEVCVQWVLLDYPDVEILEQTFKVEVKRAKSTESVQTESN